MSDAAVTAVAAAAAWSLATLAAYAAGVWLYRHSRHHVLALPVLTGTALVVGLLALTDTAYPFYAQATRALRWLAGPAIIALAVPLYQQAARLRALAGPLAGALAVGCVVAVAASVGLTRALGGSATLALSLAPKSATMPIAMAAAERVGGVPSLTAMAVVVTGVVGTLAAGPVLRVLRIDDAAVAAFTLGLTAHAIGTARALQADPATVAFAALAMSANGLATALVMALLPRWL